MCKLPNLNIAQNDIDDCLHTVDICDNVMECPCCCYFLDRNRLREVKYTIECLNSIPEKISKIKIPIYPSTLNKHYYSLNGIETIIYNLFKGSKKNAQDELNNLLGLLNVYYSKDTLYSIPVLLIEVTFLCQLSRNTQKWISDKLKSEIIQFTGSIGDIDIIELNRNSSKLINELYAPLLIGLPEFKNEGVLQEHNFSEEQIREMNYIHAINLKTIPMRSIINNSQLDIFNDIRNAIKNELESKLKEKSISNLLDALEIDEFNADDNDIYNDLPF
jgi:hypothetical protein